MKTTGFTLKPIRTEEEHKAALKRVDEIFDAAPGSPECDELEILSMLIDKYEEEKHPIDLPDPIEAIHFRMDQLGLKPKDLVSFLGYKSRVSEILNRKRKLNLEMVRSLSKHLHLPANVLINEY